MRVQRRKPVGHCHVSTIEQNAKLKNHQIKTEQRNPPRYGSGYGSRCAAWDQFDADTLWPSYGPYEMTADSGDGWACTSWCYVDESCGAASTSWNGNSSLYYNYAACDDDAALTSGCPWTGGSYDSCMACSGDSQSDTGTFGSGYGSECSDWDNSACDTLWSSYGPYEMTCDSGDGWCCSSWCYVDESCGAASTSWNGNTTLYFNYAACNDTVDDGECAWINNAESCAPTAAPTTTAAPVTDCTDCGRRLTGRKLLFGYINCC